MTKMTKRIPAFVFSALVSFAADKMPAPQFIDLANRQPDSAAFREALTATLPDADLKKGAAIIGYGPEFVWVVESDSQPSLVVDEEAGPPMKQIAGTHLWMATGKMKTGTSHEFHYVVGGNRFGGKNDVPAYTPDSYEKPGVPKGTLSAKLMHKSKIYDGMESEYWIYVPAGYDPKTPAALMVWQDGGGNVNREGGSRLMTVVDNLTFQKKIPVMIQVLINPGFVTGPDAAGVSRRVAMRSVEYDTVSDRYANFLKDEILAEVEAKYNIRKDAYSRAIGGASSGGICAFNVAWWQPEHFSRVSSHIGSFTSIQWHPGVVDGGNVYPNKVRKEPKRNIRVWLQDGSEDLENAHGSWPLQNIQLANSLKMGDYDFHLSFGTGTHNGAQANSQLPQELTWLWRDYDPSKTEQVYTMEPDEKAKPLFRVHVYNREH
jgi:enterochelin esterase-like enzyme